MERCDDAAGGEIGVLLGREVLEEDRELVAGEAGHGIAGANDLAQALADRDEDLVADLVAGRVVDELEVVDVDEQEPDEPRAR